MNTYGIYNDSETRNLFSVIMVYFNDIKWNDS